MFAFDMDNYESDIVIDKVVCLKIQDISRFVSCILNMN